MRTDTYPCIDDYPRQAAEGVPRNLDALPPGPVLSGFLASIDVRTVSGHDRIRVLRAHQRMASHYAAAVLDDMHAVGEVFTGDVDDPAEHADQLACAAAEIRAALHLTRQAADRELALSIELRERLPLVYKELAGGRIDHRRARIIADGTAHLDDVTARAVGDAIIETASNLTTGQLRAKLRQLSIEVAPDDALDRFLAATRERRIVARVGENGTAHLHGTDLPPDAVATATNRINDMAKTLRRAGDQRTMDQLRADVFLDLLTGNAEVAAPTGGSVDIRVDLTTLLELDEHPAYLAGYGPVIADIARRVAAEALGRRWQYTVTEPDTGRAITTGVTRRRPTASTRRQVEATHLTCVFPGCRMPAQQCDLDHRIPWSEGGPSEESNLAPLCRHDHVVRHRSGWEHVVDGQGRIIWRSALGHRYEVTATEGRGPP